MGNGVKVKLFEGTSGVSSSFIGAPLGLLVEFLAYRVTTAISSPASTVSASSTSEGFGIQEAKEPTRTLSRR